MLGLLNLPQNWWQTMKQQKDYIKKRKIRKGRHDHGYCPWMS